MNTILTLLEKETLSRHLSFRARSGGYFFLCMGALILFLGGFSFLRSESEIKAESIYIFIFIEIILNSIAIWLLLNRHRIQSLLDSKLQSGYGIITSKRIEQDIGWRLSLDVSTPDGTIYPAELVLMGKTDWKEGEKLELIFLSDGRFFPRQLQQPSQLADLLMPSKIQRNKVWKYSIFIFFSLLAILGFVIGFYSHTKS